jgi:ABC-2 type transport system permease protein
VKALIHSEWYKIRHNKTLAIIIVCVTVIVIIQVLSDYYLPDQIIQGQNSIAKLGQNSAMLSLFMAAFVGFFIASEFQNGTMRNILALGKNRTRVYLSKVFSACVAVAAIVTVAGVMATIGYGVAFGFGNMAIGEFLPYFSWNFLAILFFYMPYAAVFTMLAIISKSPITTALLCIGYVVVVFSLGGFINAYPGGGLKFLLEYFPEYYMSEIDDLASLPFIAKGILVSGTYIVLSSIIGSIVFNKSDIK